MAAPVAAWLERDGLTVYAEVPLMYRAVDMMGIGSKRIVMVELKTSLTMAVRRQAGILQLVTPEVYCGVGTNPNKSSIDGCRKQGLGILSIAGDSVRVVLDPQKRIDPVQPYIDRCLEYAAQAVPGHDAGRPNIKDEGPAQDVERRIRIYEKKNPGATWKELFENIPNHYANCKSMQGAMRMLQQRRVMRDYRNEKKQEGEAK